MGDCGRWIDQAIRCQLDWSSLTAERERELLIRFQTGGREADRQSALVELWESHSKLVVSLAMRHRRSGIEVLDLIGAGHLGLHTAISRFDTSRAGTRLSSFAIDWIRWSIIDHIRRNTSVMRLPTSAGHRRLFAMRERLFRDARNSCIRDGIEPTEQVLHERIGQRIGISAAEVGRSLRLLNGEVLSLQAAAGGGPVLGDTLRDDTAATEDEVILRLDQAKVRRRVAELAEEILGERERAVFHARCMSDRDPPVTLEILALQFAVTRERIHQLEASARRKIATALVNEGYADADHDGRSVRLPPASAGPPASGVIMRHGRPTRSPLPA
jgi:RNA polymerase sigma-32 factor